MTLFRSNFIKHVIARSLRGYYHLYKVCATKQSPYNKYEFN